MSGQTPVSSFSVSKSTVCIGESLTLQNTSTDAIAYEWDFCTGDFDIAPSTEEIENVSGSPYSHVLVKDETTWYGFSTSRSNNRIVRFSYGSSINNEPTSEVIISNPSGLLSTPQGLDIIYDGSEYYGFAVNGGTDDLIRIDFGNSISNETPTAVSLGDFSGLIRDSDYIRVVFDGVSFKGVISSRDELVILDFGTDITNTPSSSSIGGYLRIWGIGLVEKESNWYGVWGDTDTDRIYHADFGVEISSTATITEIDVSSLGLSDPRGMDFVEDGGLYYGFYTTRTGNLVKMEFGTDPSITTPTLTDYGDIDPANNNNSVGLLFKQDSSRKAGFATDFGGRIYRINYENNCGADVPFTTEVQPKGIYYNQSNSIKVSLRAFDANDNSAVSSQSITVTSSIAPTIFYTRDNVCVNSSLTFTPSTPGLTSYSWDFGDGSPVSNDESPTHQYMSTGTYTVRVDVNDGSCDNFYEEDITIYDSPPSPSYTYSSAQTCINADFTFTNTTSDGAYIGPLEYLWEFIDEPSGVVVATATTKDAIYAFETEGEKTVRLTSSIPGCTEITEQTLMITPGPTASFTATSVCQGEATSFTNGSLDATSYEWNFGDGFSSTDENPDHFFTTAGSHFVTLTAYDAEGCEDSEVVEISVSDSPIINFDFDVPCTSADGIQFFDLTTVDNADLVSWTWYVDDVEVSTQQSPLIVFESTGIVDVRLDVQSSNGCESSYSEEIEVLTSPEPDFNVSIGCQGEASVFTDNTVTSGNPIVSWLWTVDGTNYGTQDISHVFTEAGLFDVSLEVTGQNFCSEIITKTVEIIELPAVNFSVSGECDNELIRAQDQSTSSADPVISRRWMLDGVNVGNGTQLLLESLGNDTYQLELQLETASGCVINSSQTLEINEAPASSFTSSRTFGLPNDVLTFTNISSGAVSYQWLVDGSVASTNESLFNTGFSEEGSHTVSLVAQNSLGCYDTTNQEILIALPEVDLAIGDFELISKKDKGEIYIEILNFSNLPIDTTEIQIVLENGFRVSENVLAFIGVGESYTKILSVGIPLTVSEPSYFCVKLVSQYEELQYFDSNPVNNEKCITLKPQVQVEDPFPNPVTDQFRLKVIVPEVGTASLTLLNSAGKVYSSSVFQAEKGLNNFFFDMSTLDPGIYFVTVDVAGFSFKRKVVKL
ncbi:PKD domain-containing protein [Ekhidna sp.]|uniref:T9SS type A sorting domain-containing protein n=1 Tax=Ekhidna sp. TaxID=2608089 RepID=UPI003516234B